MWQNVGIVRETNKMQNTLNQLLKIQTKINALEIKGVNAEIIELKNLAQVAILITTAALNRKTSLGAHYLQTKM